MGQGALDVGVADRGQALACRAAGGNRGQAFLGRPPCFLTCAPTRASTAARSSASRSPRSARWSAIARDLSRVQARKAAMSLSWSIRPIWSANNPKRRSRSTAMGSIGGNLRSFSAIGLRNRATAPSAIARGRPVVGETQTEYRRLSWYFHECVDTPNDVLRGTGLEPDGVLTSEKSKGREIKGSGNQRVRKSKGREIKGSGNQRVGKSKGREIKGSGNQRVGKSKGREIKGSGNQRVGKSKGREIKGSGNQRVGKSKVGNQRVGKSKGREIKGSGNQRVGKSKGREIKGSGNQRVGKSKGREIKGSGNQRVGEIKRSGSRIAWCRRFPVRQGNQKVRESYCLVPPVSGPAKGIRGAWIGLFRRTA